MSESFIVDLLARRMIQMGYSRYHLAYRDMAILPSSRIIIAAYNQLWFVIGDPAGLRIESDYGVYDSTAAETSFENSHQHRGQITIYNPDTGIRRIKFIQAIILS
jgi:hypothetical protein